MTIHTRGMSFNVPSQACGGRVEFAYDTEQPLCVSITQFGRSDGEPAQWVFARDILARRVPGLADVRCDVDGIWTLLHLSSPEGALTLRFVRAEVDAFLGATERAVPYGAEILDVDAGLYQLLKRGVR